jgi:hypothetical protein
MLTHDRLISLLAYDPDSGSFFWGAEAGPQLAERKAGSKRGRHIQIAIDGKIYMGSRLAWFYVHGEWPAHLLRFNDGDAGNLRIANLRVSVPNSERVKDKDAWKTYKKDLRERVGNLTQETLKELLDYEPTTGVFTWKTSGSGRVAGQPAGYSWVTGYRMIHILGRDLQAARLAWLYVHGVMPEGRIKFVNEDQTDCRIANLRLARTKQEHDALFRERNPDANRRYNYTKNYQGMTIPAFDALLASQDGVCAICENEETNLDNTGTGKVRNLNVDHDHNTNAVRGILCSACNRGLGLFEDSPERLRAAADYIEKHAGMVVPIRKENTA